MLCVPGNGGFKFGDGKNKDGKRNLDPMPLGTTAAGEDSDI